MKDANSISTSDDIAKCIWKTDEFGNPDKNRLKIDSEVSTDEDKEEFINRWKELEVVCGEIFDAPSGSPMDELFTRYMYYERAKQGIKLTTTEALRKFYEKNEYALLKREETLSNMEKLAAFWKNVLRQDDSVFSEKILRRLAVLNYAPNGMWTYLVSVYFMQYKDEKDLLDENAFYVFLNKITAFIWAYAFIRPGVNALRSPVYPEMIEIVNNRPVDFEEYKFNAEEVHNALENYAFTNGRPITKSMLAWWAYNNNNQQLISSDVTLEIEHIYPRKRQENERGLTDKNNLESLGNKALLEKNVNIRAADYRFADKKKYYQGFKNDKGKYKKGTCNYELIEMSRNKADFEEKDIVVRKEEIIDSFIEYLKQNNLVNE